MSGGILTLSVETRQKAEGRRQKGSKGRRKVARYKGIMTVWTDMISLQVCCLSYAYNLTLNPKIYPHPGYLFDSV
jgi:hypothetical protein